MSLLCQHFQSPCYFLLDPQKDKPGRVSQLSQASLEESVKGRQGKGGLVETRMVLTDLWKESNGLEFEGAQGAGVVAEMEVGGTEKAGEETWQLCCALPSCVRSIFMVWCNCVSNSRRL